MTWGVNMSNKRNRLSEKAYGKRTILQDGNKTSVPKKRKNKKPEQRSLRGIRKESMIKELPKELENVRSKIVKNGMFQIFENGKVFKLYNGMLVDCHISKTNGYFTITRMVNGKQHLFYVHRLLAEAFIPNPEKKSQVIFKDNNKENISLDNLFWANSSDYKKWLYNNKFVDKYRKYTECIQCGRLTRRKDSVCPDCYTKIVSEKQRKWTIEKRKKTVDHLREHYYLFTDKQKEVVALRSKGMTYQEIGDELGKTRQGVEVLLKNAEKRVHSLYSPSKTLASHDGNKLKAIRKSRQLTQSDVANLLDISTTTYSLKERGIKEFKLSEAKKLASIFEKSLEELFVDME